MRWHRDSITSGEIDALHRAAKLAWADDTRYPLAKGTDDDGQCYVTSYWLRNRLGGKIGRKYGHYVWLSPDEDYVIDLASHTGSALYEENEGYEPVRLVDNHRTRKFSKRADRIFDNLHIALDYMGDGMPGEEPQRQTENEQADPLKQYWHDEPNWEPSSGDYNFVYCNPGEAPIWMSDLSFKRIENVEVGDKVVGWDSSGAMGRRKLCESTVLEIFEREAEVFEVRFESGRKISCTADHRWLRHWSQGASNSGEQFVTPNPGELLTHVIDTDKANSNEMVRYRYFEDAAWLGGIFDGEGSVQNSIHISQCPDKNPAIRDRIKRSLERLGFIYTGNGKDLWIKGGREEFVRFANWTNPVRRDKIAKLVFGERWQTPDRIVSVELEGTDTVYGMKTTTGNYIAWGYASKNCNGQLEVSPYHGHEQLLAHTGVSKDHSGPMAMGTVTVINNRATWEAQSNMNLKGLDRIFKDYTKHVGWDWGGITNLEGEPISDEFAPKASRTLHFVYDEGSDHLWIGSPPVAELAIRCSSARDTVAPERDKRLGSGKLNIVGRRAYLSHLREATPAVLSNLHDYCSDQGFILYAENDNVLKTIEDMEIHNLGNPDSNNPDEHQYPAKPIDEREPSGIYKCPVCKRLFPGWSEYADHRRQEAEDAGEGKPVEDGKFPEVNEKEEGSLPPAHFTEQQPYIMPVAHSEARRVPTYGGRDLPGDQYFAAYRNGSPIAYARVREGKLQEIGSVDRVASNRIKAAVVKYTEKQPKDLLEASIPFIYDVEEDNITLGHPGQRTSDIPGQFTPGGIVEGVYEPGGKVVIKSMTNMPYSVRHIIDLWYYQHPELSVTGLLLQDDSGATTKLAADQGVGGYIASLVAADPAAHAASQVLQNDGGRVYAVGGAVRDAMMGKQPKDIDLMVGGLQPAEVQAALESLPGRVDVTGKSFGVFRYRDKGNEVEIALPRREHSTGEGHRDFAVQADPKMSPQEDLYRRDFSANAMAVDLKTGSLIDPYGGANDIESGTLRSHNPESLSEDPLRVVRALVANARHGLVPDDATKQQMAENAASLTHLPPERIQQELDKLFGADNPAQAIRLAHETGALQYFLPEVDRAFGYDQNNPHHEYELGDHLTNVLERASEINKDKDVRLAALLHDIGKPDSAWVDPETGSNHFYKKRLDDGSFIGANHEELGAEMANAAMNRLRYPNDRTKRVTDLVLHHMFPAFTSEKGARKFINRVGDHADDLMDIRWADQGGKSAYPSNAKTGLDLSVDTQRKLLDQVRNSQQPTNQSQLAINGNDLIGAGIRKGPLIGDALRGLTDAVVEDPELNTRDKLLELAQNYVNQGQA